MGYHLYVIKPKHYNIYGYGVIDSLHIINNYNWYHNVIYEYYHTILNDWRN